jgi:hypothetical protein
MRSRCMSLLPQTTLHSDSELLVSTNFQKMLFYHTILFLVSRIVPGICSVAILVIHGF